MVMPPEPLDERRAYAVAVILASGMINEPTSPAQG
jgi:hypothetical protein